MDCELYGFGTNVSGKTIECGGGLQNHHMLNRGKLSRIFKRKEKIQINGKSYTAKQYIEELHYEVFLCKVCANHNAATKLADGKIYRKHLVIGKEKIFGLQYVRYVIDFFQNYLKVPEPMWTHRGIKAVPFPD